MRVWPDRNVSFIWHLCYLVVTQDSSQLKTINSGLYRFALERLCQVPHLDISAIRPLT